MLDFLYLSAEMPLNSSNIAFYRRQLQAHSPAEPADQSEQSYYCHQHSLYIRHNPSLFSKT